MFNLLNSINAINIKSIIHVTDLGEIIFQGDYPTKSELLAAIQLQNPDASILTTNDFSLGDHTTASNVRIHGIGAYAGYVDLYYSKKDTRIDIASVIVFTDLGYIVVGGAVPTKEELIPLFQGLNPASVDIGVDDFDFGNTPSRSSAVLKGTGRYKGEVTLVYMMDSGNIPLDTVILITDLGEIDWVGDVPTKNELLKAIKALNSTAADLETENLHFKDTATNQQADLVGVGRYTGEVDVTYYKKEPVYDLAKLITVTDLGEIKSSRQTPLKTELLRAIQLLNPDAKDLTTKDFDYLDNPTDKTVQIIGNSDSKYIGGVTLTYTIVH